MNTEQSEPKDYLSYLMRVWRAPAESDDTWRASLEEPHTREVHGFKDLQSLFAFVLAQTGQHGRRAGDAKRERDLPAANTSWKPVGSENRATIGGIDQK